MTTHTLFQPKSSSDILEKYVNALFELQVCFYIGFAHYQMNTNDGHTDRLCFHVTSVCHRRLGEIRLSWVTFTIVHGHRELFCSEGNIADAAFLPIFFEMFRRGPWKGIFLTRSKYPFNFYSKCKCVRVKCKKVKRNKKYVHTHPPK